MQADLGTAEEMRDFGRALARLLRAGDLVMLTGELGAGKTTLAQGIGEGLGVRGQVTSPTFIVARAHPSLGSGPALIHVDSYRISSLDDLETLDLDASLDEAVTLVEWGAGLVERLTDERLELLITRPHGAAGAALDPAGGTRHVAYRGHGTRGRELAAQLTALLAGQSGGRQSTGRQGAGRPGNTAASEHESAR